MTAIGFTTGSDSATLTSITGSFSAVTGASVATNAFSLSIYNSSGGLPGTLLETLSGSSSPTTNAYYTYTSAGNVTLTPNTTYFAVTSVTDTGLARWNVVSSNSETSLYGWSIADGLHITMNPTSNWVLASSSSHQISVSALAVPEPSTYAALAAALTLAVTVYVRRRPTT